MDDDTSSRRSVLSALGVPSRSRSRGSMSKSSSSIRLAWEGA